MQIFDQIEEDSIDLIVCDPPYGTVKGLKNLEGWKTTDTYWDVTLNTDVLFSKILKVLRLGGGLILFSQEPYTCEIRSQRNSSIPFSYPLIWMKNHFANNLFCNKAPVSYFEDISVFHKVYDTNNKNPLRLYFKKVMQYIGLPKNEIMKTLGHTKADHVFRIDTSQFGLCSEEVYDELINIFKLKSMQGFLPYDKLKQLNLKYQRTFNLPEGKRIKSNILYYEKETKSQGRFHPTQKPLKLIEDLIYTYSNEGDTVLDFTMGSGTTPLACKNLGRNYIGIEKDKYYYKVARHRVLNEEAPEKIDTSSVITEENIDKNIHMPFKQTAINEDKFFMKRLF